jgi:hypothetical protein
MDEPEEGKEMTKQAESDMIDTRSNSVTMSERSLS